VMIDSDIAVVGAPMKESVYIFPRSDDSFVSETKVSSPTLKGGSQFGASLDLDGRDILVGAHLHRLGNSNIEAGSVFLYRLQESMVEVHDQALLLSTTAPTSVPAIKEVNEGDEKTATPATSSNIFSSSVPLTTTNIQAAPTISPKMPTTTLPTTSLNSSSTAAPTTPNMFLTTLNGSAEVTGMQATSSSAAAGFLATLLGSTFVSLFF
jgi:hypothetical protein